MSGVQILRGFIGEKDRFKPHPEGDKFLIRNSDFDLEEERKIIDVCDKNQLHSVLLKKLKENTNYPYEEVLKMCSEMGLPTFSSYYEKEEGEFEREIYEVFFHELIVNKNIEKAKLLHEKMDTAPRETSYYWMQKEAKKR